ncbi:hypothetical protein FRC07_012405 [Ceratobasidium sp. 392]|nr:hypothetical protein FRC07_012405 [Ceratobasidium sp. 392]
MPPQTRSKLQINTLYPMGTPTINGGDSYEDSPSAFHGKENEDWDFRYGTPIRPPQTKRKCVSIAVQTSPIEEVFPNTPPALCRDSSASTSPDPESDADGSYSSKNGLKRKKSATALSSSQASKKAKPTSPVKLAAASPKQPRRESVASLDGNGSKPRSIYAPSPTPLQCSYIYPIALGPPRRPVDLRRAKGARIMPEVQLPAAPAAGENGEAPAPMDVDSTHKLTHRCPITFSREFEMRRHIRTVHIAEEIRAVVEGRLPREQATVIPESWDGKTLLSKPTCAGCGTTFSRPDAVRRHQTEVNAKMENGICVECPGPKVHIRRGPRKDIFQTEQSPIAPAPVPTAAPALAPAPVAPAVAAIPVPAAAASAPVAPYPPAMMAALTAPVPIPTIIATPTPAALVAPAPAAPAEVPSIPAPTPMEITPAPAAVVAAPTADAAAPPVVPTGTDSQLPKAAGERAEPVEGELESEDDM